MEIKDVTSKNEWENFVQSHEEANFLQSWQWGEFHKERGKKILRRGIYKKDKLKFLEEIVSHLNNLFI